MLVWCLVTARGCSIRNTESKTEWKLSVGLVLSDSEGMFFEKLKSLRQNGSMSVGLVFSDSKGMLCEKLRAQGKRGK